MASTTGEPYASVALRCPSPKSHVDSGVSSFGCTHSETAPTSVVDGEDRAIRCGLKFIPMMVVDAGQRHCASLFDNDMTTALPSREPGGQSKSFRIARSSHFGLPHCTRVEWCCGYR